MVTVVVTVCVGVTISRIVSVVTTVAGERLVVETLVTVVVWQQTTVFVCVVVAVDGNVDVLVMVSVTKEVFWKVDVLTV